MVTFLQVLYISYVIKEFYQHSYILVYDVSYNIYISDVQKHFPFKTPLEALKMVEANVVTVQFFMHHFDTKNTSLINLT